MAEDLADFTEEDSAAADSAAAAAILAEEEADSAAAGHQETGNHVRFDDMKRFREMKRAGDG
jgi:hypothetical protein